LLVPWIALSAPFPVLPVQEPRGHTLVAATHHRLVVDTSCGPGRVRALRTASG
jgi:hypothetical protein